MLFNYNSKQKFDLIDGEIGQVILNILSNAQYNFKDKGTKEPMIKISTYDNKISICDNGGVCFNIEI